MPVGPPDTPRGPPTYPSRAAPFVGGPPPGRLIPLGGATAAPGGRLDRRRERQSGGESL